MDELEPIGTPTHTYLHPEVPINITLPSKLATLHKMICASVSLFYLKHHFSSPLFYAHELRLYELNLMFCVYVKS